MQELVFVHEGKPKPIAVKISHEQIAMHFVKSIRTYHAAFKFALPSFATDSKRAHEGHITKKRVNQSPPLFGKKKGNILQIGTPSPRLHRVTPCFKGIFYFQEKSTIARMHIQNRYSLLMSVTTVPTIKSLQKDLSRSARMASSFWWTGCSTSIPRFATARLLILSWQRHWKPIFATLLLRTPLLTFLGISKSEQYHNLAMQSQESLHPKSSLFPESCLFPS